MEIIPNITIGIPPEYTALGIIIAVIMIIMFVSGGNNAIDHGPSKIPGVSMETISYAGLFVIIAIVVVIAFGLLIIGAAIFGYLGPLP